MSETLFIALAVVGSTAIIIFLLVFIARLQKKRSDRVLQDTYRSLLAEHRLSPDQVQIFNHRILALDTNKRVLVFVQHQGKLPQAVIELDEVTDCRIWNNGIPNQESAGKNRSAMNEYISTLGVLLTVKGGLTTTLPIYTEALDGIESKIALSKAADQWLERLNDMLSIAAGQRLQQA